MPCAALLVALLAACPKPDDTAASPDPRPDATESWYVDTDTDVDADGWPEATDCNDANAAIHPGVTETWYDGIDQDCAGDDDYDADADGFRAAPWGDDCDDTDPAFSPGTEEVWYDDLDEDCAGGDDWDADGDGFQAEPQGDDCDDDAADTWPGAPDMSMNHRDNDCDGRTDEHWIYAWDADLTWTGDTAYDGVGLARAADWTGDGVCDLALLTEGLQSVSVLVGPLTSGTLADASFTHTSPGSDTMFGRDAVSGDLDGDGWTDLVISDPGSDLGADDAGAIDIFRGPLSASSGMPDLFLLGASENAFVGLAIAATDNDGVLDLLVGADPARGDSVVWVVAGPITGSTTLDAATARITDTLDANAGSTLRSLAWLGDTNGDGVWDFVIGGDTWDGVETQCGAAFVFDGPVTGDITTADADAILRGMGWSARAGEAVAATGDLDGDGLADLAVGSEWAEPSGAAYVVHAPFAGPSDLASADAVFTSDDHEIYLGMSILAPGDVSGDGVPDLLVAGRDQANAYLGPFSGTIPLDARNLVVDGIHGTEVSLAEVDDDGIPDILAGDPDAHSTAEGAGLLGLFWGSLRW